MFERNTFSLFCNKYQASKLANMFEKTTFSMLCNKGQNPTSLFFSDDNKTLTQRGSCCEPQDHRCAPRYRMSFMPQRKRNAKTRKRKRPDYTGMS